MLPQQIFHVFKQFSFIGQIGMYVTNGTLLWKAIFDKSGRVFLERSRFFSDGRNFSRTVENFLGRSRIFSNGREFSRTVEIFLGQSRIFSNGGNFSQTVEIFNFSYRVEFFPRTVQLFLQFDYLAEKLRISGAVYVSE